MVGRLLESGDLDFHTRLVYDQGANRRSSLDFTGSVDVYNGTLEIWWSLDIDAREWGIKDMVPSVTRVRLSGTVEQEVDERLVGGDEFFYDSSVKEPPSQIGADVDAVTSQNAVRLATQWKVESGLDRYKEREFLSFVPTAEVDVGRHHIKIEF